MQSVTRLDSDAPFLTLLKREDIAKKMMDQRINVGKTTSGFTECGSSCDKYKLFCNTKFNQKLESTEQIDTALKIHTRNALNVLADTELLNLSDWKFNTCLDYIATNNIINENSCKSRKTMKDSFLATGQISKS